MHLNLNSSTDRLAWTQNRNQGRGKGFEAHKDKQSCHTNGRLLQLGYYEGKRYIEMITKGLGCEKKAD